MSPVGIYFNKDSKPLLGMEFAKIVWSSGESRMWPLNGLPLCTAQLRMVRSNWQEAGLGRPHFPQDNVAWLKHPSMRCPRSHLGVLYLASCTT